MGLGDFDHSLTVRGARSCNTRSSASTAPGPRGSHSATGQPAVTGAGSTATRPSPPLARALDLGITLFDTARAYGFGAAEELLNEAPRPEMARESVVIATKGGLRSDGGRPVRDSSPAALRRDLEGSLRSLGTEYVDLYQVHWPDPATPITDTAETLDAFVREGKVRYVGVSNYDARQMTTFQQTRRIDTLQPPCYGPMAHGLLTGRMTEATTFAAGDWRAGTDLFQGETFRRNLAVVDALESFARERGVSVAQLAIAWTPAPRPASRLPLRSTEPVEST